MRIKVYIVTYNNDEVLKKNLNLLYTSDLTAYDYSIHIINNYSIIKNLYPYVESDRFIILNDSVRPDFSNGHLARSWNAALMDGFVDLNNPQSDLVVLMQNDTFVKPHCFYNLVQEHKKYDFIQLGAGDQFMSFNVDAVKKIGMFDERFCSIQYQEADYFMAGMAFNRNRISINDRIAHEREWNAIDGVFENFIESDYALNGEFHLHKWSPMNRNLFFKKWNCDPQNWYQYISNYSPKPLIDRYFTYPYFEKDILTLDEQNYNKI